MSDRPEFVPQTREEYDGLDDGQRAMLHDVARETFADIAVRIDKLVRASRDLSAMMTRWEEWDEEREARRARE